MEYACMVENEITGRAKGGVARANNLSDKRKHEIAKKAATARWTLKATHSGSLNIGNITLPCYVLEDGTRILTQGGTVQSLGINKFAQLPKFIANKALQPFVSKELNILANSPITFLLPGVGRPAKGYKATILVDICDAVLQARKEGALKDTQKQIADQCEMLTRALAKVGIIALIDEATGYQNVRKEDALQKILDAYLNKELAAWIKRFPDEFYDEMFRLKGWSWNSLKRPAVVGRYTNDLVYERLAPTLVDELKKKNPRNEKGGTKARDHQWLTSDVGHPALSQHLHAVISFMRASSTWDQFNRMINKAFPKKGTTIEMFPEDTKANN